MPRIDLISKDEAITVGDAEGYYVIRRLPPEEASAIIERNTRRIESDTPGAPAQRETDWRGVELDQLDYIIQDWLVYRADGQRAECTRANKAGLPRGEREAILQAAGTMNLSGGLSSPLRPWKPTSKEGAPPA